MFEKLPTDKLYKFSCILGLTCLVTMYLVQEDKKEKVFGIYENILQKHDSLSNYTTKEKHLIKAEMAILKRKLAYDSTEFVKIMDSNDTAQMKELLKSHKIEYDNNNLSVDSGIKANARSDAFLEGLDNEIATLMVKLDYRKTELNRWQMIAIPICIIGLLFFLYGIFAWFLAEPIENVKK